MEAFTYLFVVATITFETVIFIIVVNTTVEIRNLETRLDNLEKYLIVEKD